MYCVHSSSTDFFNIIMYVYIYMQCERRSALETYFNILEADGPPILALIGCGCSLATEPVAEIANFNDIVHVRVHVYSDKFLVHVYVSMTCATCTCTSNHAVLTVQHPCGLCMRLCNTCTRTYMYMYIPTCTYCALSYDLSILSMSLSYSTGILCTSLQISYASSSPSLSDRHTYPGFWRTYPSEDNSSPALLAVVKQYGWRQLKILTQEESLFLQVIPCSHCILHVKC